MADESVILQLRRLINDRSEPFDYPTEELNLRLDQGTGINALAAEIWREKAARYSELVDVSESGSSRKLSDLRKGALEQAAYYDNMVAEAAAIAERRPRTRPIVRPTLS